MARSRNAPGFLYILVIVGVLSLFTVTSIYSLSSSLRFQDDDRGHRIASRMKRKASRQARKKAYFKAAAAEQADTSEVRFTEHTVVQTANDDEDEEEDMGEEEESSEDSKDNLEKADDSEALVGKTIRKRGSKSGRLTTVRPNLSLSVDESAIFADEGLNPPKFRRYKARFNESGSSSLTGGRQRKPVDLDQYKNLPEFDISDDSLARILANTSSSRREVIFTTFMIPFINGTQEDDFEFGMTAFNLNWVWHLKNVGVSHFLIIGMDEESCLPTRARGISCYVNTFHWLKYEEIPRGRQVAMKWLYLYKIVKLGFHPIFLDNDAVVLKNPFDSCNPNFDIQALSDAVPADGVLPRLAINFLCGVGKSYDNQHSPCVSTGVMFFQATVATRLFLRSMVEKIGEDPGKVWEQALFQKMVIPFMIHVSPEVPVLKLKILPLYSHHNVGILTIRRKRLLGTPSAIVHCGFIHGGFHKRRALKRLKLWHVE